MKPIALSAATLKNQVERKAYAYGVSSAVSILISEYVVELLRKHVTSNKNI